MKERRQRAAKMRKSRFLPRPQDLSGHAGPEQRSLAYHRVVARRLNRRMVAEALHRTLKWGEEGKLDPDYAAEWERVLSEPIPVIRKAIVEDSQRGRDLRQNSPFAGALSEPERRRIIEAVR
jgi:hypothetical protein